MSEDKKYFERGDVGVASYPDLAGVRADQDGTKRDKLYKLIARMGGEMVRAQNDHDTALHHWQTYHRELRAVLFPEHPDMHRGGFSHRESRNNDEMVLTSALQMIEKGQQLDSANVALTHMHEKYDKLQDAAYELQQLLAKSIAAVRGLAPMLEGATPNMTPGTVKTLDAVFTPRRRTSNDEEQQQ